MTVILDGRVKTVSRDSREWKDHHADFRRLAELSGEWAGIPLPVEGFNVRLEDRHRHRQSWEAILSTAELQERTGADDDEKITIRNVFWSARRHSMVYLVQRGDKVEMLLDRADRTAGRRLKFAIGTLGVSMVWSIDAEMRAREKLRSMVPAHTYQTYELTGSFLWTSERSRVSYVLRRCRPTIAMVPSRRDLGDESDMKILAVLCLHPLGYYEDTWAGSMVPTDDVIAHLTWIKSDEHGFWRRANQHNCQTAEAGL